MAKKLPLVNFFGQLSGGDLDILRFHLPVGAGIGQLKVKMPEESWEELLPYNLVVSKC